VDPGSRHRVCTGCGQTHTEDIPIVDHQYVDGICDICGDVVWPLGGKCGDDLTWKLTQDGILTISGTGDMYDYTQANPAPWYRVAHLIKKIVMSAGVISIGDHVMDGCVNVTEVTIPSTVTDLGGTAFSGCNSLKSVVIPEGVTVIAPGAFKDCGLIIKIKIPSTVTQIGNEAFSGCHSLRTLSLPSGLTHIGDYSFAGAAIKSIIIPASVVSIGKNAFDGCSALSLVQFLGEAPAIGENAFRTVNAKAQYPVCNKTWKADVMQNYGGTLKWASFDVDHVWNDWIVTQKATCNQAGIESLICSNCGLTQTKPIPSLTHSFTNYVSNGNATTEQDGTKTAYCDHGCGASDTVVDEGSKLPQKLASDVYSIAGGWISNIAVGTTVADLLRGVNGNSVRVMKGNDVVTGNVKVGTGMVLQLMANDIVVDSVIIVVTGDVNGDGKISITDMLAVKAHLLKKPLLTGAAEKAADTTADQKITITDFLQFKAHLLNKDSIKPVALKANLV
jgi:hypothetical protein